MAEGRGSEPAARIQETQFTIPVDETETTEPTAEAQPQSYGSIENGHQGAAPKPAAPTASSTRALAPDLLRGLLMVFQSLDHAAVTLGSWRHGTAIETEGDGTIVHEWNSKTAWTVRMLTHLCAPGFMFLLGMGVVYFGRSRSKLGWPAYRMASHFAIRAVVLALVNEVLGLMVIGTRFYLFNIVLLALAVNYFLAGLLWLMLNATEKTLAAGLEQLLAKGSDDEQESRPLLNQERISGSTAKSRAESISWHIHNVILLALAVITIWWNIWMSPNAGHCTDSMSPHSASTLDPFLAFLFRPVQNETIISPFPPLAWLSFAILGLLYARIVLARPWSTLQLSLGNLTAGLGLMLLFVATRLLHVGNLSEDCLHMAEHDANPDKSQYLTSFRAFFYIIKYPPSPAFLTFTLSLNFLWLALFTPLPARISTRLPMSILLTYGTSALFFYFWHLVIYSLLSRPVKAWFGHDLGYTDPFRGGEARGTGNEPAYWITWLLGLLILYPMCRYYGRFKSRQGPNSLWRFF